MDTCQYCGVGHTGMCYRVKAIEYYENGAIKRVELHGSPGLGTACTDNPAPARPAVLGDPTKGVRLGGGSGGIAS